MIDCNLNVLMYGHRQCEAVELSDYTVAVPVVQRTISDHGSDDAIRYWGERRQDGRLSCIVLSNDENTLM